MDYSIAVGASFLKARAERAVLKIGSDTWNPDEVAALGIIETRACGILNRYAEKEKVKNLKQLYAETSPYELAGRYGLGVNTLLVLLRAYDSRGLDAEKWYRRGQKEAVVQFLSLKARELKAEQRTRQSAKRRRRPPTNGQS